MDDEMWYSMTPEEIAKDHAKSLNRLKFPILLDPFCGFGGDLLYLSENSTSIACDISLERLKQARVLQTQLGSKSSDFVVSNFMSPRCCFRENAFDAVYLSPPWGHRGVRNRKKSRIFGERSLRTLEIDGFQVFMKALKLCKDNIMFYLPRGMKMTELKQLAEMTCNEEYVFVKIHVSHDPDDDTVEQDHKYKVRSITVYFGDLARQCMKHEIG
jgi:tRNA G10  N-methylase Trm11